MSENTIGALWFVFVVAASSWPFVYMIFKDRAERRRRRVALNHIPTPSDVPTSNQGGGEWVAADVAVAAWFGAPPKSYGYAWADPSHLVAEWQETATPAYGWVVNVGPPPVEASCRVEVAPPTELDAIAARFDAAWDEAARAGRASVRA